MPASALSRIRARGHIGIRLGLGRMQALLATLGDPQHQLRGVLIAGTNGKGSVAAMVASVLAAGGYSTGQSPSPHLHSYRERVTIDGHPVTASELDRALEEVLAASEPSEAELGPATEFELLTAAAYLESARRGVEVMVMEVGLGGRLDASNAWDPDVAAITNIGLDHEEFLGETVEAVAAEKAAIIKPGGRAVTGAAGPALEVIRSRAASLGVPLAECAALPIVASGREGLVLRHERLGALRLPLVGRHQAANAGVALGILDALEAAHVASLPDDAVRAGLAATDWPGRLEIVESEGTTVVLDGAHNPAGVAVLVAALDEMAPELPPGPATLLLGVLRDKEVDEMVRLLAGCDLLRGACLVATTVPGSERALPAKDLASAWGRAGGWAAEVRDDADAGLARALALAAASGAPLVIAGSLYLVGHVRARLVPGTLVDHAT